jgi:exopolyphosphatase/guanosine-5'-triphosphate,3'-diphosphate pyrophosphatase
MKVAVLDLGTNTFNLLVAQWQNQSLQVIDNNKIAVKIGKGGIHKNKITEDAAERAFNAIKLHKATIDKYNVKKIFAIGTSAFRTAANANQIIDNIHNTTGISIEVISGEREAELIYLGVRQTLDISDGNFLIVDIGGGSNELIFANSNKIIWKESFPLGMARLIERFQFSDPIKESEIAQLNSYFDETMQSFSEILKKHEVKHLAGAEGAFESFINITKANNLSTLPSEDFTNKAMRIDVSHFYKVQQLLQKSTLQERLALPGLEPFRVEMIVPAGIFIKYIVEKTNSQAISISPFSLKEGVAWEFFNNR